MMLLDYGHNNHEESKDPRDVDFDKAMVAVDRNIGDMIACARETEQADVHAVKVVDEFIQKMNHQKVDLKTDGALAMLSLQEKVRTVRTARGQSTNNRQGRPHDSPSMGPVESAIRWWRMVMDWDAP